MKRICFVSLGCPKNRVDTEVALASCLASGYELVTDPADADVIVVNTCGFIGSARQESVETLLEMADFKTRKRGVKLVAMGCLAQDAGQELLDAMPELDLVAGTGAVDRIASLLASRKRLQTPGDKHLPDAPAPRVLTQSTAFAYLKVADGCNRTCSFCTIPRIKGGFQSRPVAALTDEAWQLAKAGVRELVLVAQDLTQYGLPGRRKLLNLLDSLEQVEGIEWIRLMYLYPDAIPSWMPTRLAAGGKVLPYLDMPVQHVDDRVLRLMRRGTTGNRIRRTLDAVRAASDKIAVRTTLIVGHPGEDDRAFDLLERFVVEAQLDHLGVFTFSAEPGTVSANLPGQVPRKVAGRRRKRLMEIQQGISLARNQALVGTKVRVLTDAPPAQRSAVSHGRTERQAPEVDGRTYVHGAVFPPGQIVDAVVTKVTPYDLHAQLDPARGN